VTFRRVQDTRVKNLLFFTRMSRLARTLGCMAGGVRARRATVFVPWPSGRSTLTALTATLLWLAALLLPAAPASAHTELENTVPADGARLTQTPGSVQMNFTEPVDAELASLVVRAPDGRDLTAGPARQSGPGLIQPITASPQAGTVQVSYRVVSLDGHPVTGTFAFEVLRGDPDAPQAQDGSAAAGGGEDGSGVSLTGPLLGALAVLLLVVGGAVLARRRRDAENGRAESQPHPTTPPAR
jgi:methionine-rich copper-binding protein CopC